jgi:hypothetical protein
MFGGTHAREALLRSCVICGASLEGRHADARHCGAPCRAEASLLRAVLRVLFPAYGIELRPEWSALLMSVSSIIVATNAVLRRWVERELT